MFENIEKGDTVKCFLPGNNNWFKAQVIKVNKTTFQIEDSLLKVKKTISKHLGNTYGKNIDFGYRCEPYIHKNTG